jgi:hypothetical protein
MTVPLVENSQKQWLFVMPHETKTARYKFLFILLDISVNQQNIP